MFPKNPFKGSKYDIIKERKRFGLEHIKENEERSFWDKNFFFNKEEEAIKKWIEFEAKNLRDQQPKDVWERIEEEIKDKFIEDYKELKESEKEEIVNKLLKGEYQKLCPKYITVWLLFVLFILSIIGETAILIVQALMGGGFNPIILLYAGLLAVGGSLIGHFMGKFFTKKEAQQRGLYNPDEHSLTRWSWFLILGVALTLFVAFVRAFTDEGFDIQVFILTILLALVVAFFECLYEKEKDKREKAIQEQERALRIYASKRHKESLKRYRNEFYINISEKPEESIVDQNSQAKEHMDMLNHNRESQQNQNPQN